MANSNCFGAGLKTGTGLNPTLQSSLELEPKQLGKAAWSLNQSSLELAVTLNDITTTNSHLELRLKLLIHYSDEHFKMFFWFLDSCLALGFAIFGSEKWDSIPTSSELKLSSVKLSYKHQSTHCTSAQILHKS